MATRLTLRALTGRLAGDLTVSRRHCLVEVGEYGAWVEDLGSLKGTFVTGQKVRRRSPGSGGSTVREPSRHALRDGDELRVRNNIFAVMLPEAETGPVTQAAADQREDGRRYMSADLRSEPGAAGVSIE